MCIRDRLHPKLTTSLVLVFVHPSEINDITSVSVRYSIPCLLYTSVNHSFVWAKALLAALRCYFKQNGCLARLEGTVVDLRAIGSTPVLHKKCICTCLDQNKVDLFTCLLLGMQTYWSVFMRQADVLTWKVFSTVRRRECWEPLILKVQNVNVYLYESYKAKIWAVLTLSLIHI